MLTIRSQSDGVVIREVLNGDRERFDSLVERHYPAVYATALAYTRNSGDAEDVVQETFLKAFTSLDTLRTPRKFGSWVLTIARNKALTFLRGKKDSDELSDNQMSHDSPLDAAQRTEFYSFLSEAIAELPEGDREAILLHYFSGQSAREVAQSLGVSRSAVLKRLERGRAKLGKHLLKRLGDENSIREDLNLSIRNVTRGIAAASVTWKTSSVFSAGSIFAATTAVLPSAGMAAAAVVGGVFTVAVGWQYLSNDSLDFIEATPEPIERTTTYSSALEPNAVPEELEPSFQLAMQDVPEEEEGSSEPEEPVEADSETASFENIDGAWDFTIAGDGYQGENWGRATLSTVGGQLNVVSEDDPLVLIIQTAILNGRDVTIALEMSGSGISLTGQFNEALTKLTLDGTVVDSGSGEIETPVHIVGTRVSAAVLSRDAQIDQFKAELMAIFNHIEAYKASHSGVYPETLLTLFPHLIDDQSKITPNETRSLAYRIPPPPLQNSEIGNLAAIGMASTEPDEVMEIEAQLAVLWGDFFVKKPAVLESTHRELEIRATITSIGEMTITPIGEAHAESGTARSNSTNAACMNNMKQLGLSCKMFESEQTLGLFPPGWRILYPEYLSDTRVLTCPNAEPGTESYELLIPASNSAFMEDWALEVEELPEGTNSFVLQSKVAFVIETHECSNMAGRNILYLDGHVSFHKDGEWESIIEPYRSNQTNR
jgi:RNA polymerase sigma-70 factor (ECF subfamily)